MTDLTLFPSEISENEVLYIIGNGFDKAHDILSGYKDFRTWVQSKGQSNFVGLCDSLFSTKNEFWGNIEESLGDYDKENILDFCRPDEEFDLDHSLSSSARVEDSPMSILEPALEDLRSYFVKWVNNLVINGVQPILNLYINSFYLTFNYTETLETVYGIPSNNICHIHGSRLLKNDKYLFGHNNTEKPDDFFLEELPIFEENAYRSIIEYMGEMKKPIYESISAHNDFFKKLSDIKLVYIIGHSLSEIDKPYFDKIFDVFNNVPYCIFTDHKGNDKNNIMDLVDSKKIKKFKIIDISDLSYK